MSFNAAALCANVLYIKPLNPDYLNYWSAINFITNYKIKLTGHYGDEKFSCPWSVEFAEED